MYFSYYPTIFSSFCFVNFKVCVVGTAPCALILASAMAMYFSDLSLHKANINVRSGSVIEKMADAKMVVFDKTG